MEKLLRLLLGERANEKFVSEIGKFDNQNWEDLIEQLTAINLFMMLDWSGEEENGDVISFIKHKIQHCYGVNIPLDDNVAYKEIERKNKAHLLEKGDAPIILFDKLNKQLKKQGYQLIFLNSGNDQYIFTVVEKENFKKILSNKLAPFEDIPKKEEELQVVECLECGTIFFPQYGDGDETYCDCGKLIWPKQK